MSANCAWGLRRESVCAGSVATLDKAALESLVAGNRDADTMIVLYAPWCPFCKGLEDDFNEFAANAPKGLKVAKYQADLDRDYCQEQFDLQSYPTITFLPKNNKSAIKYSSDRRTVESMTMWANALAIQA